MNPERWRLVSPYLDHAMEMTEDERSSWLASLGEKDPSLAAELKDLLEEQRALDREGFLEKPPSRPPPPLPLEGQTLGAYTLVSLIGQGGMGNVWLARRSDGRFQGRAAVKLLNASLVGRAGEERFRREGSILARLLHPHIAHLVDAGVSPAGQPYLVLEHVDGEPIDRYADARGLAVEARLRLFLDVLAAVALAHANLIVHRDIKPSNVLVTADGQVKLLDFGIAKLLEGEAETGEATALTREGGRALTPEYAAPEQVTGEPITTATDVYALGTLLYVLLCGRHPAEGAMGSPAELVRAIVDTEPRRLSDVVTESRAQTIEPLEKSAARRGSTPDGLRRLLRGDLDTIVAKALKKRPEERYPSVTALAEDVKRYLAHKPISARPDTLAYRAAKFVRRNARGVAAAAAVVILVGLLVGFYTSKLAKERDRARLEAEKATKVSELLTGLLTGADPYAGRKGRDPTVRGILDAGAVRIEKEFTGEPELQAEMLTVMGEVYRRMGLYDKAQPLLEKGLAIGRRALGPESERVAQTLNDLGVLLGEKGDYAAAGPVLEQALAVRRRALGSENKDVAVTLVELARVCSDRGDDRAAEPLVRESLAIRRKVLGEEDHETATSKSDLAMLLWRRGDLAGADALFGQALAVFRRVGGDEHPDVASTLNNRALVAMDRQDYPAAEVLLRESLALGRKALGDKHPDVALRLNNLSGALRLQGKYDEAAACSQEALAIAAPALGNEHPQLATYRLNLGRVDLDRGQWAAAEPLLREALRVRRRAFPESDWRVGVAKSLLGEALTHLARYDEAERLLLDAHAVLKDGPGQQGREARATLVRLAALYDSSGRPEKAAAYRTAAPAR